METYKPIQVLKFVAKDIWIVDGPLIKFKGVSFPTRMTVVRLSSGELFIHSPIELTQHLKEEIERLGEVKHLVSPNRIHYWWIGEWKALYPNAISWASPGSRVASRKAGWEFDKDLSDEPEIEWREDIEQLIVKGSRILEEVVFYHKDSNTLILADLIENFEAQMEKSLIMRIFMRLAGNLDPDGKLPIDLRMAYIGRHKQLKKAIDKILAWSPDKVIIAHGRWYEMNGVAELKRAFRWIK
ncbi:DUF4336 domain-containing protein [Vreelandella titanicae]|uniref:DUF4336 domain-containing protein n=1 Tax=Vreelandella titanicae TaxID=664683 RepID=UPI0037C40CD3